MRTASNSSASRAPSRCRTFEKSALNRNFLRLRGPVARNFELQQAAVVRRLDFRRVEIGREDYRPAKTAAAQLAKMVPGILVLSFLRHVGRYRVPIVIDFDIDVFLLQAWNRAFDVILAVTLVHVYRRQRPLERSAVGAHNRVEQRIQGLTDAGETRVLV